jgi:allophanate hydrolase
MSHVSSLDIAYLRAQYQSGELSPAIVVQEIYQRCDRHQDNPIWVTQTPREHALQAASTLEAQGYSPDLPLYGIPIAVKDNIDVAGLPTTNGCPGFSYTPSRHAVVVEKLLQAGALIMGKTAMDQFATGLVGVRSPAGACRNPFNPDYISGGSSSGSAVAVSLGLVSAALGTDTAGSGRVPAAFTNIVGLKPTRGLLSTTGVVPACRSLDCVSVFALTCADAQHVLQVLQGFDPSDSYARDRPSITSPSVNAFRFGVPLPAQWEFFGDQDYRSLFEAGIARLEAMGGTAVAIEITPFLETAALLYGGPWVAERYAAVGEFTRQHPDQVLPVIRQILAMAENYPAWGVFHGFHQLAELQQQVRPTWDHIDCLLLPTTGTIYTIQQVEADPLRLNSNLGYYTNFVNLLDLSAIALPAGFRADGLPGGITLIAPAWSDHWLCQLGTIYHQHLGGMLGATPTPLPPQTMPDSPTPETSAATVSVAVLGAHLTGMPLNHQLTSRHATLVKTTRTAPYYQFFALAGTTPPKPGIIRIDPTTAVGYAIEVEVWDIPIAEFGSFVAEIPPPLGIGSLVLEDGTTVKGFICEGYAIAGATDISHYGGWRSFMQGRG